MYSNILDQSVHNEKNNNNGIDRVIQKKVDMENRERRREIRN